MRIIQNSGILGRQSENYIRGELSNVAMVIQSPQILTTYYSINADASTLVGGFKNIEEFIGKRSSVIYDKINNLPMAGVDNLVMMSEFNDDTGHDVDFSAQGIIFPNTIVPKPGDCFTLQDSKMFAIFVVTDFSRTVVRSNPFVQIDFRLWSQDEGMLKQLESQVRDEYEVTVTALGSDKTLLIKKSSYFDIQEHLKTYLEVVQMYISMFYDRRKSMFVYDQIFDDSVNLPLIIVDMVLWEFLYENGIIVYDDAITYAINNFNYSVDRVYIDDPRPYIDLYEYSKTPIARLYERNRKKTLNEYPYPQTRSEDIQITKYSGVNLLFIETYGSEDTCGCDPCECGFCESDFTVFDEDFLLRIMNNVKYCCCEKEGINWKLRNAIIAYYNDEEVNFDDIELEDKRSVENFYLIPILLGIYKQYIISLQ